VTRSGATSTLWRSNVKFGVIVGNRGFFPSHLCKDGRKNILDALERNGIEAVAISDTETEYGAISTSADARKLADLFRKHRDEIDGVVLTLPNFGEERPIGDTLRWADLGVPVLVQATSDDGDRMSIKDRRDSFCGKMSACNNLRQIGIKYSLTASHTVDPRSKAFDADLQRFAATCRVVKELKHARVGAVGARPAAFKTVRFSEKLLEQSGISVETLDLSELLGWANRYTDSDPAVKAKLEQIREYTDVSGVPADALVKMAKLGAALDKWTADEGIKATAIQCWTSLEEFYGVVPCTLMSMSSNAMMPSACETDVAGLIGMMALKAASNRPAALLDWNNNYADDPNKGVVFHCSNLPKDFFIGQRMDYQEIIAGTVGKDNTYGTIVGQVAPGPFTYLRVSTDDINGIITTYVGEGRFTEDKLLTFGGYGVVEIPEFQTLLRYICQNGFEHHVAATKALVADAVEEALGNYLDWEVYHHGA
jgi:L-fucose isomerase-like protein